MVEEGMRVSDPAAHQPTKSDMEEDVSIDATPKALAWAVTRGGAERRQAKGRWSHNRVASGELQWHSQPNSNKRRIHTIAGR